MLAALALPVYQSVSAKSDEVTCVSRLRQLGTALISYANENNRAYPPTANYYSGHASVIKALEPYTQKSAPIWFCTRYLKDAPGRNAQAIYDGGEFGYYYWAFDPYDATGTNPISVLSENTAWSVEGYNTSPVGNVLLSDIFGDHTYWGGPEDVQMHAGTTRYLKLQNVGTHVFLSTGNVTKIAPKKTVN